MAETANEATTTAGAIVALRDDHRALARDLGANGIQLLDYLFAQPLVNVNAVGAALRVSWPTANKLAQAFAERGILVEATGFRRNRVFRYSPYLALFSDPAPTADSEAPAQTTEAEAQYPSGA